MFVYNKDLATGTSAIPSTRTITGSENPSWVVSDPDVQLDFVNPERLLFCAGTDYTMQTLTALTLDNMEKVNALPAGSWNAGVFTPGATPLPVWFIAQGLLVQGATYQYKKIYVINPAGAASQIPSDGIVASFTGSSIKKGVNAEMTIYAESTCVPFHNPGTTLTNARYYFANAKFKLASDTMRAIKHRFVDGDVSLQSNGSSLRSTSSNRNCFFLQDKAVNVYATPHYGSVVGQFYDNIRNWGMDSEVKLVNEIVVVIEYDNVELQTTLTLSQPGVASWDKFQAASTAVAGVVASTVDKADTEYSGFLG